MELNKSDYIRLLNVTKFISFKPIAWILNKFNMGAITFGTYVFIDKDLRNDADTILHELVHVQQYINHGFSLFLIIYLYNFFKGWIITRSFHSAYMCVPFEIEAYDYEDWDFYLYYYTSRIPQIGL